VLNSTHSALADVAAQLAATHSTGDVIDWLVAHHLDDALDALSSSGAGRRNGVRPRRPG
jgi:hypothetical protein